MAHSIQLRLFLTTERCERLLAPGEEIVLRQSADPHELALHDPAVTRRPEGIAGIRLDGDQLIVRPTEDANPILLNGEKVTEPRPLHAGDRLRIGFSVIVVQAADPVEEAEPVSVRTLPLSTSYIKGREQLGGEAERLAQWSEGFDELKAAPDDAAAAEVILRQLMRLANADRGFLGARSVQGEAACRELSASCLSSGEVERLIRWFNAQDPKPGVLSPTIGETLGAGQPGFAAVGRFDTEMQSWLFYLEPGVKGGAIQTAYRSLAVLGNLLQLRRLFQERTSQQRWVGDLTKTVRACTQSPDEQDFRLVRERFVFHSAKMAGVCRMLARVAAVDCPVLLLGEPGTGKQLAAEALHAASRCRHRKLVVVRVGEFPEEVVAGELFGTKKGAFTGAVDKIGLVEHANGGTLFLDEIGEVPPAVQAKLLGVLQDRKVRRLGSLKEVDADFRLICATNRDLLADVRAGRFRQDLYDRINVVPIVLPPLRERADDIPLLAGRFLEEFNGRMGKEIRLTEEGIKHLGRYSWPDNVRGLRNYIERTVALAEFGPRRYGPDELPPFNPTYGSPSGSPSTLPPGEVDELVARLRDSGRPNQSRILTAFKDSTERLTKDAWGKRVGLSKPIFRAELQKLIAFCLSQDVPVDFFDKRVNLRPEDWEEIRALGKSAGEKAP